MMDEMSKSMKAMPDMAAMDMSVMQACMDACAACEQACTVCSTQMMDCSPACMNCADMANTMMRMMLRPAAMDMDSMMAMLQACMVMGNACAAECMSHSDMSEQCRMCAVACQEMAAACEAMMTSMKAMM